MRALAALLLAAVAGCAAAPACRTQTQLYFGTAIGAAGARVDEADWRDFVAREVAARFPDGFSIVSAQGQYRSPATGKVVAESAFVLTLLHPDRAEIHQAIDAIAAAYKARFAQESVLRVDSCAAYSF